MEPNLILSMGIVVVTCGIGFLFVLIANRKGEKK